MFELTAIGKWLFLAGLGLAVAGGLIWLGGRFGLPLGRLPGDIRIERDGGTFYIPLATSILISLLLTIGLNIIIRLFRR